MGISRDSEASHQKFADKLQLPYSLLVDQDQQLHEWFGVLKNKTMFGKTALGVERSTFILDQDRRLAKEFRNVKASGHVRDVLEWLENSEK